MDPAIIYFIIGSLVLSAMFSGVEIAFISADKLHIELQKEKGSATGKILSGYTRRPAMFIGTMLVGNTLTLTIFGLYMTKLLTPYLMWHISNEGLLMTVQVIISTVVVLITAEFPPKSLFMINPNRMLQFFAWPVTIIYYLMFPMVWVIVKLSKLVIVHVLKWEYSEDKPVFGLTDLNNYIVNLVSKANDSESEVEIDEKIFTNALDFKSVKVRECMIPRIEIVAVDYEDGVEVLRKEFIKSGYSKILIYKESIDNIIGYCHSSQLFKKPESIDKILTSVIIVPETQLANELLITMIKERKSIALVVDEFGGTSGIVTMEDVIEEIFGEIMDEHDDDELIEQMIDEHTYIFSGRHEVDYINEKYDFGIPEGEYETIGGFILSMYQDIPKVNQVISSENFIFTIKSMQGTRIDKVRIAKQ